MKVKTDLFARVGVVKAQKFDGNVSHEMLYDFPSFSVYFSRETGLGFIYVASGPLVRSSYRAGEFFIKNYLQNQESIA